MTLFRTATHPRMEAYLAAYEQGPGRLASSEAAEVANLDQALNGLQESSEPFTIAVVDNFLPPELYSAALRGWPSAASFDPVAAAAPNGYVGSRRGTLLEDWKEGQACDTYPWNRIRHALRETRFVRRLFGRFPDVVEATLGDPDVAALTQPNFRLYANLDTGSQEALGAHVDALAKLLTIVIYLDLSGTTGPGSEKSWGTALYETQTAISPLTFSANAGRTVAHHVEFRPNRAFIMPNSLRSLHGVAGGEEGVMRRTLMCGYWLTTAA